MEAATIEMDAELAAEKAEAFKRLPELTPEDEATMKGYEALAKGKALIDLVKSMREAGLNEQGLPKLAIARADEVSVMFAPGRPRNGGGRFRPSGLLTWKRIETTRNIVMPSGTFDGTAMPDDRRYEKSAAFVPSIPPEHRPRFGMHNYHILWEAEWKPVPPVDPMLLRHLSGSLYVVLAEWDLTPLEQAVLQGRITAAQSR